MLDHVNIARFISSYESKYNLSIQEFLTESDRKEIIGLKLIRGKNHIFDFATNDIKTFLEKKVKKYLHEDLLVSHTCILKLINPAPPHIDGHFPFYVHYNKIYCIIKVFIVPLAFDTDLDATAIETGIVTFKQHYCKPRAAGYEFLNLFLQDNLAFENFSFVDQSNLPLTKHSNFYADKSIFKYLNSEKIKQGLDIDRISYLKLGDLSTLNPYQVHCSTDFEDKFSSKYVLRFAISKLYNKNLLKDFAITNDPHQLLLMLKSNF